MTFALVEVSSTPPCAQNQGRVEVCLGVWSKFKRVWMEGQAVAACCAFVEMRDSEKGPRMEKEVEGEGEEGREKHSRFRALS